MTYTKLSQGYSLLELLLYIAIAGLTLIFIVYSFTQITTLNNSAEVRQEIDITARDIIHTIENSLATSDDIITPQISNSASTLTLVEGNITTTYSIVDENLIMTVNGTESQINPISSKIQNLTFTTTNNSQNNPDLSNVPKPIVITISFDLSYRNPVIATSSQAYSYTYTIRNTIKSDANIISLPITTNLGLWIRADKGIVYNGANIVTNITDQSSSPKALTTANVSYVTNAIGNKPALRFNGVSSTIQSSYIPASGANPRTMIVVMNTITPRPEPYTVALEYGGNGLNQGFGIVVRSGSIDTPGISYGGGATLVGSQSITLNRGQSIATIYTGTSSSVYWNNMLITSSTSTINTGITNGLRVGSSSTGTNYFQGDISEILVYNRALTNTELSLISEYLGKKYNLPYRIITQQL